MDEIIEINTNNLVLQISRTPPKFLNEWEDFLNELCENRKYQKEAIIQAITFVVQYNSVSELFIDNYKKNPVLKNVYKTEEDFLKRIQLNPNTKSINIDIATGGGKSYVMYGIAQIMLSEKMISKVLLLCPSTTIEKGLKEKFKELSTNENLQSLIPSQKLKSPSIIDGNSYFENDSICIENIHSIYKSTNSSLDEDFFKKEGKNILILNDESHHIYNKIDNSTDKEYKDNIKKWKEFLVNQNNSFKTILGFTGTPYIDNMYFNDVIYKYSLRKAIEDNQVKQIEYLNDENKAEKNENFLFDTYYQIHQSNIKEYPEIKPLSIMITSNIEEAIKLKNTLINHINRITNEDIEVISKKVLLITSKSNDMEKLLLESVDQKDNSIEWIVSVSMLTEGWDVKNVLQIIPMEERAFESKLLISQVIGRGLRKIPTVKRQQKLKVINHPNWDKKIDKLVKDVLEIETKLKSSIILENHERYKYNFDLHSLVYKKEREIVERKVDFEQPDIETILNQGIKLITDDIEQEKKISFSNIDGKRSDFIINITKSFTTTDDLTNKIFNSFFHDKGEAKLLNINGVNIDNLNDIKIKEFIAKSLDTINQKDFITVKNEQRILQVFNRLIDDHKNSIHMVSKVKGVKIFNTSTLKDSNWGLSNFRDKGCVVYDEYFEKNKDLSQDMNYILKETLLNDELEQAFPRGSTLMIENKKFKTPLDIVFSSSTPEKKFIKELCNNSDLLDCWVKSKDTGFYSIEYSLRKNSYNFNPDFFIKVTSNKLEKKEYIIVVEIKQDDDINEENKMKNEYALKYFESLNNELNMANINKQYIFTFLSPESYNVFFKSIKNGDLFENKFNSELNIKLQDYIP